MADPDMLLIRAQEFVDRKYVARADERQKSMGLAYVEAERQDLAREIARFSEPYLVNALSVVKNMSEAVDTLRAERDALQLELIAAKPLYSRRKLEAERDALALQVLQLTNERDDARARGGL